MRYQKYSTPIWDCCCFWWNTKHSGHALMFLLLGNYLAWRSHSRAMRGYQMSWSFKKQYDIERMQQHINLLVVTAYQFFLFSLPTWSISPLRGKARLTFYEKVYSFPNKTSNSIIELIIELYLDTTLYINRSIYLPYFISEFNYYNCIWYKFIDDYCRPLDLHKIQWSKSFSFLD